MNVHSCVTHTTAYASMRRSFSASECRNLAPVDRSVLLDYVLLDSVQVFVRSVRFPVEQDVLAYSVYYEREYSVADSAVLRSVDELFGRHCVRFVPVEEVEQSGKVAFVHGSFHTCGES